MDGFYAPSLPSRSPILYQIRPFTLGLTLGRLQTEANTQNRERKYFHVVRQGSNRHIKSIPNSANRSVATLTCRTPIWRLGWSGRLLLPDAVLLLLNANVGPISKTVEQEEREDAKGVKEMREARRGEGDEMEIRLQRKQKWGESGGVVIFTAPRLVKVSF